MIKLDGKLQGDLYVMKLLGAIILKVSNKTKTIGIVFGIIIAIAALIAYIVYEISLLPIDVIYNY